MLHAHKEESVRQTVRAKLLSCLAHEAELDCLWRRLWTVGGISAVPVQHGPYSFT